MSLKTTLISTLVAMGLISLADKIKGQQKQFNIPDPVGTCGRKKASRRQRNRGIHKFGISAPPRHRVQPAQPCYVAPGNRAKRAPANKLELLQHFLRSYDDRQRVLAEAKKLEPFKPDRVVHAINSEIGRCEKWFKAKPSAIIEAAVRANEIVFKQFEIRLQDQRAMIYELGGDPDAGDTLEWFMDEVRLVRADRPGDRDREREIRMLAEPQTHYVAR
jgi:hypothetical protein